MPERNPTLELALDRHWDAVLNRTSAPPADEVDPGLAATVRRVRALDVAPPPHPAFAATLWEDLMDAPAQVPGFTGRPGGSLLALPAPLPRRTLSLTSARPVSQIAAAILMIVLLTGSLFAAFYPLRSHIGGQLPLFVQSSAPTAQADPVSTTLFDLTLSDAATYRLQNFISLSTYPPGSKGEGYAGKGPSFLYVVEGPLTLQVNEASQPVRVLPAGATGAVEAGEAVAAGQQATLETGAAFVAPAGSTFDLFNTRSITAKVLYVLSPPDGTLKNRDGASWSWSSNGGAITTVAGPLSVVLRQVTLPPDQTLPVLVSGAQQTASTLDPHRVGDMRSQSDGAVRNGSDEPLELYVLTVLPLAVGTPVSGTPSE